MSADAHALPPLTETELAAIEAWASAEGAVRGPAGQILRLVAELRQTRQECTFTTELLRLYQRVLVGRCKQATGPGVVARHDGE
jgi:hypothetical protein